MEKGRPIFCLTFVCALLLLLAFVCALLLLACVLALLRCILRCSSLRDVEARQQLATDTHRHENQKLLAEILTVKRVVEVIGGVAEDLDGEIFPLAAPICSAPKYVCMRMCTCIVHRALCIVHCARYRAYTPGGFDALAAAARLPVLAACGALSDGRRPKQMWMERSCFEHHCGSASCVCRQAIYRCNAGARISSNEEEKERARRQARSAEMAAVNETHRIVTALGQTALSLLRR